MRVFYLSCVMKPGTSVHLFRVHHWTTERRGSCDNSSSDSCRCVLRASAALGSGRVDDRQAPRNTWVARFLGSGGHKCERIVPRSTVRALQRASFSVCFHCVDRHYPPRSCASHPQWRRNEGIGEEPRVLGCIRGSELSSLAEQTL